MMLRSPFPYFGGKSAVSPLVWKHFGTVRNFVEPFFGSGAMLLCRPQPFEGTETVNDLCGFISNFWRSIAADPDAVAHYADWPVNELDMQSRHLWLVNEGVKHVQRLRDEPDYFDAKIAGWWVWGACQWIGSGWCVHRPSQKRPHLGNAGSGVHRPSQKRPHLGDAGRGEQCGEGHPSSEPETPILPVNGELYDYFAALSDRFRRVRVCCGDWERICGPTPTVHQGLTAVFLDPPYSREERDASLYAQESDCAIDVRRWCMDRGNDRRIRIALCGYEGEGHEELLAKGWRVHQWKARGGYASQGDTDGENARRERIWFSPHCVFEKTLFE